MPTAEIGNEDTFTDLSPRMALSYDVTDQATVYATVSRGYKAGGFSLARNGADNSAVNEPFRPEILTNYELGVKSELFDGRARFNAAIFQLDWKDLQLETFFFLVPGDATSNVELTINVQNARATGLEAELAALITENLTITGGVGLIDTEILSDDVARLSGNLFVNLKGEPLPAGAGADLQHGGRLRVHAGPVGRMGAARVDLQGLAVLDDRRCDLPADQRCDDLFRPADANGLDRAGAQPHRRLSVPHA